MTRLSLLVLFFTIQGLSYSQTNDTLLFNGQASAWLNYNFSQDMSLWGGGRYIPQLNYSYKNNSRMFDAEASANISGSLGTIPFDSINTSGSVKPYRLWLRYSGEQFEIRAGLQKINFGSSAMLRPLMWFDKVDPRDPLQLTDGVWAVLGRYYFLNNANLWIWGILPSENLKTWEITGSNPRFPEAGGRFQFPLKSGEMAFSLHTRTARSTDNNSGLPEYDKIPEYRFGLDGKWDLKIGLWFEATHTALGKNMGIASHLTLLSAGADYTFGIGNGLNLTVEHLQAMSADKSFKKTTTLAFSGLSVSYPLNISTNISYMAYYDWRNNNSYNIINIKQTISNFDLHILGYVNPVNYQMPYSSGESQIMAGNGIQLMLVYHH